MSWWRFVECVFGGAAFVCVIAASLGAVRDALEDNRLEELRRK